MDEELSKSVLKTGTSIVGIVCKDGVVMAGDRRATAGNIAVSKNTQKVVKINDWLVTSGTGMASDIEMVKKIIYAQLRLKELKTKSKPTVKEAANLIGMMSYQNIRQPTMVPFIAGTLVAGKNEDGSTELYSVEPAGTVSKVEDFDANFSSGMPFILGLLERKYNKSLNVKEGAELALECIKSSTQRDTGSGNGIDVFTITKDKVEHTFKQIIEANYKEEK
jgi:proteasome beta subunit